jgi:hypothetical protein
MSTRRDIVRSVLTGLPAYALLAEIAPIRSAFASDFDVRRWIDRHQEIALGLARGELSAGQWQTEVEALSSAVDLPKLIDEIGRARTVAVGRGTSTDPVKRTIRFVEATGEPRKLRYGTALFTFGLDDVVTPHAHRHMVSAHLIIDGMFRVRTFDRLRDEDGAIVIRPATDGIVRVGDVSTMSSERNNVHWFVPQSDRAATFDVVVAALDKGEASSKLEAVDPVRAIRLADGSLRAPILSFEVSSKLYTRDV